MNELTYRLCSMPFPERLTHIRKQHALTQEALGGLIGITKTQIYRYEKGHAQPTLDVIKRLAVALSVTTDELIFEQGERQPDESLNLLLEGISILGKEEKHMIKEIIEGILLKHRAKQLITPN